MLTRYPLLIARYILLVVLQALVLAGFARAQLTHLDSTLARSLTGATGLLDRAGVNIAGDSSLLPLIELLPHAPPSSPAFYIDRLSATITTLDSNSTMLIQMHGSLLRPGNPVAEPHEWSFSVPVVLAASDRAALETSSDRYVQWEAAQQSFWARTAEPVLVILGAVVIVALFFLLRS